MPGIKLTPQMVEQSAKKAIEDLAIVILAIANLALLLIVYLELR